MRFSINLATRTYIDQRLLHQISVLVVTVLVLLCGWNVTRMSWNLGEQQRLVSEIKVLEGSSNIRPDGVSEKDYARQQGRVRFFNEIIDRKGTDWLNLLELVEMATPEGISLAAFTPGKKRGELRLDGYARSFAVVRQYVEKLEGSKSFSDVLLLSHQEMIVGEKGRGVQFSVSCKVQFQ
jgi:type IV pilus assembly protein PilN